jgi:MoaA/NifB/PqqE/SkfB family radical SAM enzyme
MAPSHRAGPTARSAVADSPLKKAIRFDFAAKLSRYPHKAEAALTGDLARALSVVYLDVNTDICNHNCTFCDGFYRSLRRASIPTERLLRLIDEMEELGVLAVVIAGDRGEPLLHPGMASILRRLAAGPIQVGLYTNGSVLPDRLAGPLRTLAWARLSADAGTAATHQKMHVYSGRRDDFSRLLRSIALLAESVTDVGVSFILDPVNVNEAEQAADVLLGAGAHFIEYKPKYLPDYTVDAAWLTDHADQIKNSIANARARWGDRIVVNNQVAALIGGREVPSLEREYRRCITSALRMVISSHGCYPCTPYRGEQERRFGNVLTQSLREILETPERGALVDQPCNRCCAYDSQNDFLLDIAANRAVLPASGGPARPQDAFI